jgi:hypothetical protein
MEMMEEAEKKCATAEDNVIAVRERATARVREERAIQAKQEAKHDEKVKAILQKRDQEYEASIKLIKVAHDKKFSRIKKELDDTSKKLSEQHELWCKYRDELDHTSKARVVNERHRSRELIQEQIDKASEKEKELQGYISALKSLNCQLRDKVTAARQGQRRAQKQVKSSMLVASKRLDKLKSANETIGTLKDELTLALKSNTSQQEVLDEYKLMVEELKSTKCNLHRVRVSGRGGGRMWPLWVTEVCCDLLIHGTPPSAIPSNIGTLFVTLTGEEPKELPSVNYVRQCRVLIQIIAETITAMKLAAHPNWAQIFFDATTRRQLSFSAVIISLMGDEPGSVDPVIVSSCVIMEDETSEMQVTGIVAKVREPIP